MQNPHTSFPLWEYPGDNGLKWTPVFGPAGAISKVDRQGQQRLLWTSHGVR